MNINSTEHYHRHALQTLGWELTVCNAVAPHQSPCRRILKKDEPYGQLLYRFLSRFIPIGHLNHILEIGGGYGYLMRDFLQMNPHLQVTMLDISPYLLQKQSELLQGHRVIFRQENFLDTDMSSLAGAELAVLNENIGDFPTIVDIPTDTLLCSPPQQTGNDPLAEVIRFMLQYDLAAPALPSFHFNLGAVQAVEKLCSADIPAIFISEHSCEARVPEALRSILKLPAAGLPERIALHGHDEYTIQFSYLEKIAARHGYQRIRGPLADFIPFEMTDRLRCCLTAPAARTDDDEIIRHFVEDLFKYEYLLLTKQENTAQGESLFDLKPQAPAGEPVFRLAT